MTTEALPSQSYTLTLPPSNRRVAPISDSNADIIENAVFGKAFSTLPTYDGVRMATAESTSKPTDNDTGKTLDSNAILSTDDRSAQPSAHGKATQPSREHGVCAQKSQPSEHGAEKDSRYTYLDCMKGKVPTPKKGPGKGIFQLLMVGGMVSFMATFTGILHNGLEFFSTSHWMYPLVFCLALMVRLSIADKVVGTVAPRVIFPRFTGTARGVAMSLLNVGVMSSIMGSIMTLLLNGTDGYLFALASTLPLTFPFGVVVNFFIVGPAVRLLHHNVIEPRNGLRVFFAAQRFARPLTALFGN